MNDIDEMDIHWYFEVKKATKKKYVKKGFIDQLW